MSVRKTAYHPPFTDLLQQKGPRWVKVTGEVPLGSEPLRVDDLIELRAEGVRDVTDEGETLCGMWRHLRRVGLLEYKSVVWPFHHGDLFRLLAYGFVWLFQHQERPRQADGDRTTRWRPDEVTLFLVVPSLNKALRDELAALRLALPPSVRGYHAVEGAPLPLVVVDLGAVAEHEADDFARTFAGRAPLLLATRRWMSQHLSHGATMTLYATPDLEGYDVFVAQCLAAFTPEERLAGLAPEVRLAGIPPEVRLAGLPPEVRLAGLAPEERLAGLAPEERLAGIPPEVRLAGLAPEVRLAGLAPEVRLAGLAPDERLAGLAPEERLAGLAPEELAKVVPVEQRLVGLSEAEQVLALPDHLLRALSEEYIDTLPQAVQATVRARRAR